MYDLVTIGAGPAGMTASIYASCFKLDHITIGKLIGGQLTYAPDILNYPGFEEISGPALTAIMKAQLERRGGQIVEDMVITIKKIDQGLEVTTEVGKKYQTKSVILATGVERRKLNIPGETEYTAKGVQYCAKCERYEYKDSVAVVVGGANSAAQTAIQVAHMASKVHMIYRGAQLRCDQILLDHIQENPKIEVVYKAQPVEILGDGQKVTAMKIKVVNQNNQEEVKELKVDRVFIEIGGVPGTALLAPLGVKMDPGGYIDVDETLSTNVAGIFAAGDVISHKYSIEQISSAVGLGARAAVSAFSFLKQQKAPHLWGSTQVKTADHY